MDIPVFGWYRSRKTGTASCIRLRVSGNKKAGVCCNRKHRLHVFVTFPQALWPSIGEVCFLQQKQSAP